MKYKQLIMALGLISLATFVSCKRSMTKDELEGQLKAAMSNSLNKQVNFDSTKAKFDVMTVNYFEDKTFYQCEFRVRLRKPGLDTTGGMAANISKDFLTVNRKY
jgi:hypothetical protein